MKKQRLIKHILLMLTITVILIITNVKEVKGSLQANRKTHYTKTDTSTMNWMTNFRKMEEHGKAMGLNEELNIDLTALKESNNIDVHMIRATEYGAMAILSTSEYGKSINEQVITSTTGNNTGVIINTDLYHWEWVAGGLDGYIFPEVNNRYYDTYTDLQDSARIGDALGNASTINPGCAGWHSASFDWWVNGLGSSFARGATGLFSFAYNKNNTVLYCRGSVVCGIGV